MSITRETKLSEIVKENFRTAEVLENHGLDFCCGGKKSLADACAERKINLSEILNELSNIQNEEQSDANRADTWELDFLIDYILNTHHKYVRSALPLISAHAQKVAEKHGENHPETKKIASLFSSIRQELEQHMYKEEQILFPYIENLAEAQRNRHQIFPPPFGTIQNPIRMMEYEHESAGNGMHQIHSLSDSYSPPPDACMTFQLLYKELKEFENDLHRHIHLENNILFPKAITLEKELFPHLTEI